MKTGRAWAVRALVILAALSPLMPSLPGASRVGLAHGSNVDDLVALVLGLILALIVIRAVRKAKREKEQEQDK